MQYDVFIGERARKVVVQRAGDAWTVTVDGRAFDVHAARVDGALLSLLVGDGGATVPSRSVPAVVVSGKAPGARGVHVNGRQLQVTITESGRARRRAAADGGAGPQRLVAPMPGKVVRVLVAPGDVVEAGQGLVVVEAMKMENELRAAKAGRVASVSAVEGQSVEAGAVLAVVE